MSGKADTASDLVAGALMQAIRRVVDRKTDWSAQRDYAEARAAAPFVLMAHGTDALGGPPIEMVLKALVRMRSDLEWLSGWNEPSAVAKVLDREIAAVVERASACNGCKRRGKRWLDGLREMAAHAASVQPPAARPLGINRKRRTTKARVKR